MKFKYRSKISFTSFFLNFVVVWVFFYLIFYSQDFKYIDNFDHVQAYTSRLSVLKEEIPDWSTINVNNIYIDNDLNWAVYYVVQRWDSLSKISVNFWVTVSHIKKVNKLKSDVIKPWQRLTITDEEWFVYISKWEKASKLAKIYKIKTSDILESNWLSASDYEFAEWDEVFIPMSDKDQKKFFKKNTPKKRVSYASRARPTVTYSPSSSKVISRYWWRPNISNWFYRGQCTWYVAIKKFPYISANKQRKLRNGNANQWYANAKAAWYKVWRAPKVWSIVVIKIWWARYYYAWHVAIVKQINRDKRTLLVEEMNAKWKFVVTKRRISMDKNIIGYIYL